MGKSTISMAIFNSWYSYVSLPVRVIISNLAYHPPTVTYTDPTGPTVLPGMRGWRPRRPDPLWKLPLRRFHSPIRHSIHDTEVSKWAQVKRCPCSLRTMALAQLPLSSHSRATPCLTSQPTQKNQGIGPVEKCHYLPSVIPVGCLGVVSLCCNQWLLGPGTHVPVCTSQGGEASNAQGTGSAASSSFSSSRPRFSLLALFYSLQMKNWKIGSIWKGTVGIAHRVIQDHVSILGCHSWCYYLPHECPSDKKGQVTGIVVQQGIQDHRHGNGQTQRHGFSWKLDAMILQLAFRILQGSYNLHQAPKQKWAIWKAYLPCKPRRRRLLLLLLLHRHRHRHPHHHHHLHHHLHPHHPRPHPHPYPHRHPHPLMYG